MGVETLLMAAVVASAASGLAGGLNAFQTARYNADVLTQQSKAAREDAAIQAQLALEDGARATSTGVTVAAKAGGGFDGSARSVLEDLGRQNLYEARRITSEGVAIADAAKAQAKMEIDSGNIALLTSSLDSASTLMGGMMQKRERMQQSDIRQTSSSGARSRAQPFNRRRIDGLHGPAA